MYFFFVKYIDMNKSNIMILIVLAVFLIGGIFSVYKISNQKTEGQFVNNNKPEEKNSLLGSFGQNGQQASVGGRRKMRGNKKSTKMSMTTTGVYLLLAAIIVGFITSKFV
jgi:Na+/proline symporter